VATVEPEERLSAKKRLVVQLYIERPLTLDGYKV
jgi:hypothetical protein